MSPKRPPISAADLLAELKQDPRYRERQEEREIIRVSKERELLEAQRPILKDLESVGVAVSTVWDLVNTKAPYPKALPVIMQHLERGGYPDRVMEGLARSMATRAGQPYWSELAQLYANQTKATGFAEGLAVAVGETAGPEEYNALVSLILTESLPYRVLVLESVWRLGGNRAHPILEDFSGREEFSEEARRLLASGANIAS